MFSTKEIYGSYDNSMMTIGDIAWYGGILLIYAIKEARKVVAWRNQNDI